MPDLTRALNNAIQKEGITFFSDSEVLDVSTDGIRIKWPKNRDAFKNMRAVVPKLRNAIDTLEGIATFFTEGIADERIAYGVIGVDYCNAVMSLLPAIVYINDRKKMYKNTLSLFVMWHTRREESDLFEKKADVEEKLNKICSYSIDPIGTT